MDRDSEMPEDEESVKRRTKKKIPQRKMSKIRNRKEIVKYAEEDNREKK